MYQLGGGWRHALYYAKTLHCGSVGSRRPKQKHTISNKQHCGRVKGAPITWFNPCRAPDIVTRGMCLNSSVAPESSFFKRRKVGIKIQFGYFPKHCPASKLLLDQRILPGLRVLWLLFCLLLSWVWNPTQSFRVPEFQHVAFSFIYHMFQGFAKLGIRELQISGKSRIWAHS